MKAKSGIAPFATLKPFIIDQSFLRKLHLPPKSNMPIHQYYRNPKAVSLRKMVPNQLEVDHRFPQVRWSKDESYDPEMSEIELHAKFQLLTRQNNLWKSRYCEHCAETGERGTFIGINFFAEGGSQWDQNYAPDDEQGCYGCFWYDPDKWRQALNKLIDQQY